MSIVNFVPFDWGLVWSIVPIVVLLCCSALASGSETALFSLSPSQLDSARKHPSSVNNAIMRLLSDQDKLLATILILNNLVNILIISLCNNLIDNLVVFHSTAWEFAIKTVAVTFILLLFGEIIPKVYASYNPSGFSRLVALPLEFASRLLKPLSFVLVRYSDAIQNRGIVQPENISMEELENALEITENPSETEKEMLSGIVQFASKEVEEIMHPRMEIVAIDEEENFDEVRRVIIESGYSRIPVYKGSIDHIVGMLYVKDMLRHIGKESSFEWNKLLRPAFYTPEHKKINELLEEFQTQKVHIAIVVDEYGSTLGLVSLEDILEEIVGEISDESDAPEEVLYKELSEGVYLFEGKANIGLLEEVLELHEGTFDDCRGEAETVAGLMLEAKKEFLRKGDKMVIHGIKLSVMKVTGHYAEEIKVEKL
ncbi:MAG: gliding motility-associated protein GldE [Tidjanibacter sp.]|nr:gliding motility-associated protein GldE [Tidjanibacter sp.]